MTDAYIYSIEGTFESLLTAVFESFERKHLRVSVRLQRLVQPSLLVPILEIIPNAVKAGRVWNGLKKKVPKPWLMRLYVVSLSEQPAVYQHLFNVIRNVFSSTVEVLDNYGDASVLYLQQLDRKVHREKHRMEAFVRFQQLSDGLYFSLISPDYNVLPLIASHFKNRYADQKWLIYDERRLYGIHYDGVEVAEITLDFRLDANSQYKELPMTLVSEHELLYRSLWKRYFQSANIPARKNAKLHIQHVPKRYWRYLTEKDIK